MERQGSYGNRLGHAFRMPNAPTLVTRVLQKSTLAVTELRCDHPNFGRTNPIPREEAHLVALQLRACPNHDLYFDGRLTRPENYREGVTSIYDLRRDPVADIRDPYHSLMFYL
ncbi:MAG TPA: AraC family transcriptional regulator, partial [Verrucomicrobiae bacterium]|nr:AraC family transcriptional regulator [Verrucomicrobiae bacterium]